MRRIALVVLLCPVMAFAGRPKPCVDVSVAPQYLNKDICISAHIYDVVMLGNGMSFMDVCPPSTPDVECRFTIVSLKADREAVGELEKYRGTDVHVRGIVEQMHGRAGMVLSHARQFTGGPPQFRANPRLLRGFGGEMERGPVGDPNLRAQGGRRAFMNSRDQVPAGGKAQAK